MTVNTVILKDNHSVLFSFAVKETFQGLSRFSNGTTEVSCTIRSLCSETIL